MLRSYFQSCSLHCTKIRRDTGTGNFHCGSCCQHLTNICRTIHGMVYNAMKLFMEINPTLFDDCSHDYTELQNSADQRQQARKSKWDQLTQQANQRKNSSSAASIPGTSTRGQKTANTLRVDEVDPMTQDSQKRLDALRLQDEGHNSQRSSAPEALRPRHERTTSGGGASLAGGAPRQNGDSSPAKAGS